MLICTVKPMLICTVKPSFTNTKLIIFLDAFILIGEVSIDFKVDRDTTFVVLNVRDMNITERALFKSGGSLGPKLNKALDYPQADQTYIEFKVIITKVRVVMD